MDAIKAYPEMLKYVSFPTIDTVEDFMNKVCNDLRSSVDDCLFAILDKKGGTRYIEEKQRYAGVVSLSSTDPVNYSTEIGIIVFPTHQRTHVTTNAIGLILMWTLDPPSIGGLGLRRVQWQTHADNTPSRLTALRMGFEFEGIARWKRVVPASVAGLDVEELDRRNGTAPSARGRHTAVYSIVWDEWNEKRVELIRQMQRCPV